jgi:hypothetical protein
MCARRWGVGRDDLVSPAGVEVEQGQLGTRVRSFAAGDEPCAVGVAVAVLGRQQGGDLADLYAVT